MVELFKAIGALAAATVAVIGALQAVGVIDVRDVTGGGEDTTTMPTGGGGGSGGGSTATEAGFRVVEEILHADPPDYTGSCPVTINFSGRISAAGGSGTVSYRFVSDGGVGAIQSLDFDEVGSKDVSTTWQLGAAGFEYAGWEAIEILDPQNVTSEHAEFSIHCQ